MWNDEDRFFEYAEIRRRIERRLPSNVDVIIHAAVYFMAVLAGALADIGWAGGGVLSLMMGAWCALLLLHSFWAYRRGAGSTQSRAYAIQAELSERYEADDTALLETPRQAFRLQSLLDEDVRMRAGWIFGLNVFLLGNGFFWLTLFMGGWQGGRVWGTVPFLAAIWFPGVYAVNYLRRMRRDGNIRRMVAARPVVVPSVTSKQKRSYQDEVARYTRLTDDGELVEVPEEWAAYDRGKRG
jgi:hypothetical protein